MLATGAFSIRLFIQPRLINRTNSWRCQYNHISTKIRFTPPNGEAWEAIQQLHDLEQYPPDANRGAARRRGSGSS
jgi:hypothetical protein